MLQAIVFDIDGTLVDSVDLHPLAWHEAFSQFGHSVSFEQARSQIGKGGDQLIPRSCLTVTSQITGQHSKNGDPRDSNPSISPAFDLFRVCRNFFCGLAMPGSR